MSLTSFVKTPEILRHVLAEWPTPPFDLNASLLAPPLTRNYGLVGTAFDYLLRFHLKRLYPKATVKNWVAEHALNPELLAEAILMRAEKDGLNKTQAVRLGDTVAAHVETGIGTAKKEYEKFLASGKLTDDLLRAVIGLARIDPIYRAGYIDPNLGVADPQDMADLRRLYEILPASLFAGRSNILLNPTFPFGSELVGGADCDVILDADLLDFKTVKALELKKEYWAQLVGYAVLADLATAVDDGFPRPKSLSIYFCRHGAAWTYPVEGLYKHPKYPAFVKWFVKEAQRMFPPEEEEEPPAIPQRKRRA